MDKIITEEMIKQYTVQEKKMTTTKLRKILFAKDPKCYYCGIETKAYQEICDRDLRKREKYPPDLATVEHLYDRFDPRRYMVYENFENKVLACYRCNQKKAKESLSQMPKEYLEARALLFQKRRKNKDKTPRPLLLNNLLNPRP